MPEIVTAVLPDEVLLPGIGDVRVSCCGGRLLAFLPLFPDGSGTGVYAGPCPCEGDKTRCGLRAAKWSSFDLDNEVARARDLVVKADSLPLVTEKPACPKGCQEEHTHRRSGMTGICYSTFIDELVPYARRCVAHHQQTAD